MLDRIILAVFALARTGVTRRAHTGETVLISGADLIPGWSRQGDTWSVVLPQAPIHLLRDGRPLTIISFDLATKTLAVAGFNPRTSVMETIVREHGLNLQGRSLTMVGLTVLDTLAAGIIGMPSGRVESIPH